MAERLPGRSFSTLFTSFEQSAFRLEVRGRYAVDYEVGPFRQFLAGEEMDTAWLQSWKERVERQTAEGKTYQRVRLIMEPPTDYQRFLLHITPYNLAAGEDIRYLPLSRAEGLKLPNYDFWMFDSARVGRMDFDGNDRLVETVVLDDPEAVAQHCAWRDLALDHATPFTEYLELKRRLDDGQEPAG